MKAIAKIFIHYWLIVFSLCVYFFSHSCLAYSDTYSFTGSVAVIYDQSVTTHVEEGIFNFTADKVFDRHSKADEGCFSTPSGTTKNIDGFMGIKLAHGFFAIYGKRDASGDHYVPYSGSSPIRLGGNDVFIISIATKDAGSKYSGSFVVNQKIADVKGCLNSEAYGTLNISNMTITISDSACAIATSHNMAFIWPSVSPSQLQNGSAEIMNAPVRMDCSNSGGTYPVAVTFSSKNGNYDAANGIVKTNHENLGLQLTWASTGKPIPQGTEIDFPGTSNLSEDFSVNAKPVQTGSGVITGGDFSTSVTMSIEYR